MLTIKSFIVFVLFINTAISNDIIIPTVPVDSCLQRTLTEIVKDFESLIIYQFWSDFEMDEIVTLFMNQPKIILTDRHLETPNNCQFNGNSNIVLILATIRMDVTRAILSLQKRNLWNVVAKFIVLYKDEIPSRSITSTETFSKEIIRMFANLSAFNVHVVHRSNNGIKEFSWFPYEDSNCDTVRRVKLINECEFGLYQNYSKIINESMERSECTITVGVQSYEPYSFYSKELGILKEVGSELVEGFARWTNFNVELESINKANRTAGFALEEL